MESNQTRQFSSGQSLKADDMRQIANSIRKGMPSGASNTTSGAHSNRQRRHWQGIGGAGLDETLECFGVVANNWGSVRIYNPAIKHSSFLLLPPNPNYIDVQVLGGTLATPHFVCAKYARFTSLQIVSPAFSTVPNNSVEYVWLPIVAIYLDSDGMSQIAYRLIRGMPIFLGEI